MSGKHEKSSDDEEKKPIIIRNTTDLQRLKLEKLMKNPDKPVLIPERPKEKGVPNVPDFVRNVMGSSAGAGSGEFHVYRHLRRKEYARQKYMQEKGERERLEDDYRSKLEENKRLAEEKTAKKRAKRLKRKKNLKKNAKKPKTEKTESSDPSESESDNEEAINKTESKDEEIKSLIDEHKDNDKDCKKESGIDETKNIEKRGSEERKEYNNLNSSNDDANTDTIENN